MLKLIPVVEVRRGGQPFDWAPWDFSREWVELGADVSSEDIAHVLATLAVYNRIAASGTIEEVVRALEDADSFVLAGGLMVSANDLEIRPGCCCGLEDWRDWYAVAPGGSSPWLGHDPSPWVECKADHAVIWADGGDRSRRASVPYSEVDDALRSARSDLLAFAGRLSDWLSKNAPESTTLSRRFAVAFDIS